MEKRILMMCNVILFFVGIYFSANIFFKFFFNEFLLEAPDLRSLSINEASILIRNSNLKIRKMGEEYSELEKGKIYSQLPIAGRSIKKERLIKVWISKGKNDVTVPNFNNLDILEAKVLAEQKGFKIKNIAYTPDEPKINTVIASEPIAGSIMTNKKEISFLVSSGQVNDYIRMPDIIGLTQEDAREILQGLQVYISEIEYMASDFLEPGIVVDMNISVNERIKKGSSVEIVITE